MLSYSAIEETGRFFGEVQPDVMDSLLNRTFFEKVTIYDFQALCLTYKIEKGENITERQDIEEICEKQIDLFVAAEDAGLDSIHHVEENKRCVVRFRCIEISDFFVRFRPYYIVKIPNSSLLLVVVENIESDDVHSKFVTSPQDVIYEGVKNPCQKLILNDLERRPLGGCYNEHPMVGD